MINARFDLYDGDDGWTAHTHCTCGTTVSGAGIDPTSAVLEAMYSMTRHLEANLSHRPLVGVYCACDQCKAHDSKLSDLIYSTPTV